MLIEIKNKTGKVIFSLDKVYNTFKETLEEAVKEGINLRDSDLRCANLSGANLIGADLRRADLRRANLSGADLRGAKLSGAKLSGADLRDACLIGADLSGADLRFAYLSDADLRGADLSFAYFTGANLKGANFDSAKCYNADLRGAKNVPDLPMVCPKEGSFIGWKKIGNYKEKYKGRFIVKLEIPEDAKRSSATSNKCRCSKAKVLEIKNIETGECVNTITNLNICPCVYKVGEMVYPDSFNENRWVECSHGIHFFMTEQEAKEY